MFADPKYAFIDVMRPSSSKVKTSTMAISTTRPPKLLRLRNGMSAVDAAITARTGENRLPTDFRVRADRILDRGIKGEQRGDFRGVACAQPGCVTLGRVTKHLLGEAGGHRSPFRCTRIRTAE